jgi:N-acetylmuramoyl-L-alanine amidase
VLAGALAAGCARAAPPEPAPAADAGAVTPRWPQAGAPLAAPALPASSGRKVRVYLDAGHGAAGNAGALSWRCEKEEDFTLDLASDLAQRLTQTGRFEVAVSRKPGERVSYPRRRSEAEAFHADALVSLHFDVRGSGVVMEVCPRNDASLGFALLYADAVRPALVPRRRRLAEAVAGRLAAAGFLPYDGVDYPGHYVPGERPGVFVNTEGVGRKIWLLREPKVPSVIIETHQAVAQAESERWHEDRTREVFAAGVAAALLDATEPSGRPVAAGQ